MQLIDSVRRSYRPVIPDNASRFISSLIQDCWKHDSTLCPSVLYVSQSLHDYLESTSPHVYATDAGNQTPNHNQNQLATCSVVHGSDKDALNTIFSKFSLSGEAGGS